MVRQAIALSPAEWIAFAVFTSFAAVATRGLRRFWRHETTGWDGMPEWWLRGVPVAVFAAWGMLIGALAGALGMSQTGRISDVFAIITGLAILFVVVAAVLWTSVVIFHWPKSAVPPHLRGRKRRT